MLAFAHPLSDHLLRALEQQLRFDAATVHSTGSMLSRLQSMAAIGIVASIIFSSVTAAAALLSAVGAGGWVFSLKPIAPQFNRLNPISGTANLFSKQQMATVAKMVLLTGILSAVAWKHLSGSINQVALLVLQPSPAALQHVASWLTSGLGLLLLVVLLVALVDVPLQAFFFKDRLKMSHEEVKQEHKESEGNPEIKGKLRQRQREIADRASITAVPKADFVVMNPTHYAVALRYDDQSMHAPQVISKGTDLVAMKIREIAKAHGVPVLESPVLARALYAHAELDQAIPAALYTAVAQVLAYVYRLKAAMRGEGRMPDTQPDPYVPPELDPLHKAPRQGKQP